MFLKISLSLLPALLFTQNYAWMTQNRLVGWGFILIWLLMVATVWSLQNSTQVLNRSFRLTEISLFLMPISTMIMSLGLGSSAISSTTDAAEQAGTAIGTAIGGTLVTILAFIFGITGGIIFHIIANNYSKKLSTSGTEKPRDFLGKHGLVTGFIGVILLAIILGSIGGGMSGQKNAANTLAQSKATDTKSEEAIKVTAVALYNAYKNNEVAANQQYKNKLVEITGVVDTIGEDITSNPYISFKVQQYQITSVQCMFAKKYADQLATVSKGQSIKLKGTVSDSLAGQVIVRDCQILS